MNLASVYIRPDEADDQHEEEVDDPQAAVDSNDDHRKEEVSDPPTAVDSTGKSIPDISELWTEDDDAYWEERAKQDIQW